MTEHRYQAHADIVPGECELSVDGRLTQLITLTLTDAGPITRPDGSDYERPGVICPLRVCEARSLAGRLTRLADQADDTRAPTR
ncbi:MAG: hypothetical protein LC790_15805 [Actinobacteria bacterium]|nr:hypothetical protein [Actinomycetota bacterium]MCA1700278.1 hypothetical protein [Actinomycetota bacterium]